MKSFIKKIILTLFICSIFATITAFAQEEKEAPHIFIVTTHRAVMPDDGSPAERDSLIAIAVEIANQNPKVLSRTELRHAWGSDNHDWVIITEYKTWGDIEAAGKVAQELNEKKWPDAKQRREFFQKIGKYFDGHSDEIYRELPQFKK